MAQIKSVWFYPPAQMRESIFYLSRGVEPNRFFYVFFGREAPDLGACGLGDLKAWGLESVKAGSLQAFKPSSLEDLLEDLKT